MVLDARATLVGCGDGGVSNGLRLDVGLSPECSIIGLRVNVACDPWGIIGGRGGLDARVLWVEGDEGGLRLDVTLLSVSSVSGVAAISVSVLGCSGV